MSIMRAQFTQEICVNLRKMANGIEVCFLLPGEEFAKCRFLSFFFCKKSSILQLYDWL